MEPALNEPVISLRGTSGALSLRRFNGAGPERAGDQVRTLGLLPPGLASMEPALNEPVIIIYSIRIYWGQSLQWSRP